jgi:hypothetical protein
LAKSLRSGQGRHKQNRADKSFHAELLGGAVLTLVPVVLHIIRTIFHYAILKFRDNTRSNTPVYHN